MVSNDLPHMFGRHVLLLCFYIPKFVLFCISLGVQLLPLACLQQVNKEIDTMPAGWQQVDTQLLQSRLHALPGETQATPALTPCNDTR